MADSRKYPRKRLAKRAPRTEADKPLQPTPMRPAGKRKGMLRTGNPGCRGGVSHSALVRADALDALGRGVRVMDRRLNEGDDNDVPFVERRAAFDSLAKVALSSPLTRTEATQRVAAAWEAVRAFVAPAQHEAALAAYRAAWSAA